MPLDDRLERRQLGLSRDTYKDDMNAGGDKNPLDNILGIGLAVAGLGVMYKKGWLKPVAKGFVEVAEKVAQNSSDKAYTAASAIKKWSVLENLSKEALEGMDIKVPEHSMFRGGNFDRLKEISDSIKLGVTTGSLNMNTAKTIINDTATDMKILKKLIVESEDNLTSIRGNYHGTDLISNIKELDKVTREIMANTPEALISGRSKASEVFIKNNTLGRKEELEMLKTSGFRPVMLQDVIKAPTKDADGKYIFETLENAPIDLYDAKQGQSGNSIDYIKRLFEDPYSRYMKDGKTTNMLGDWDNTKRMIIDKNLLVDESGKLIDVRMSSKMFSDFKKSVATDFKIPGLGFNPLTSLLPNWGRGDVRPATFGILSKDSIQPFLTGMAGDVKVGDVFGSDVLVFDGEAFKVVGNQLEKVADGIVLNDISRASKYGLSKKADLTRKMSGLEYYKYKVKEDAWFKDFRVKGAKFFDTSQPDSLRTGKKFNADGTRFNSLKDSIEFEDYVNIDGIMTEKGYKKMAKRNVFDIENPINEKTPGNIFGDGPKDIKISEYISEPSRKFLATKKGMSLSGIKETDGIKGKADFMSNYLKSFFVGRNKDGTMNKNLTEDSLKLYGFLDAVFGRLGGIAPQLGFSTKSKANSYEYVKSFALKRVLPIYAMTQVPGVLNALSEPIFQLFGVNENEDGTDNRMNISKFITSEVIKPLDIGMHNVKDLLGITKVAKAAEEYIPGYDLFNELPGIYNLGLNQTKEEREEYIEKGMDPIRKGRYWSLGNTPFTGGKIMYWRPNLYRRVAADVEFSDSKWGSRQEYYNNTWYPNPINPLAPLNHFVFDRNHYDKKHYYDRPYLMTSSAGSNIPIIGPLFSSTIGSVISPPQRMHEEYWQDRRPIEKDDETNNFVEELKNYSSYQRQMEINNSFVNNGIISYVNQATQISQANDAKYRSIDIEKAREIVNTKFQPSSPALSNLEIYTTPSGASQIVDIPDTLNLWDANKRLREASIKKMYEADTRITPQENKFNPQIADYSNEKINNRFLYGIGEEFNTLSDMFGMKGFELQAFVTGEANKDARIIENSNYAYSFNKSFWDENLGGLGGDASEIFRRFVQKRNTSTEYVNPIRNTMPSYMPGRDYFTDFLHGDAYSKIDNGEERLPGEGYERLYGINSKKMFSLGIGSSYIGKTKEDMMKHFIHQDNLTSFAKEVTELGTEAHEAAEKALLESGLAISTEGRIEDKQNNILGFYDAEVHDPTSETGKAIVDIKTVGQKKFDNIVKEGTAVYENQAQVNYYLWSTNNTRSNGYVYYINRDNPEQRYMTGFKFDKNMLKDNLNTLRSAREEIHQKLESGEIGRGELYDNLDRFRILADVAPYSDEYASLSAILANDNQLSIKEREEISQIKERVTKQKEPLRVYPYKFKTANLQSEEVTVKKIIDNNTLLVDKYGTEHAIKFAGIHVSESGTEKYDDEMSMNDAANKELKKFLKKGQTITINFDADDANKFNKDSTDSIKSVVYAKGKNVNHWMVNKGLAKEKEEDNTPAGIRGRYSKNEIAFGSAMETITHKLAQIPFVGNKSFQVKSPYEQYRDREVYGKDFQSWNHPIKDFLVPQVDKLSASKGVGGIVLGAFIGAFIGSLFGKSKYGKIVGGTIGVTTAIIGKTNATLRKSKDKDWIPERRKKQHELNEYFDTLKYVKNMSLYQKYKEKALKEDHINIDKYNNEKELQGIYNKNRSNELKDFKKIVKLDFKHRKDFDFKYGDPKYVDMNADRKDIISKINMELSEIQSDRSIERVPENVVKAITYKQQAEQTMYGYETGDPLNNLMTALPKKERQYFKYFMKAPEEEKDEILRIAPDFLRRGLQQAWGMDVDEKPTLQEYFQTHGLPDDGWIGWNEDTDIENVKVKLVHNNNLDMGEFDLWDDQIDEANQVNIPVPKIRSQNSNSMVQLRLKNILGKVGYEDVVVSQYHSPRGNRNTLNIHQDSKSDIADQIYSMNV